MEHFFQKIPGWFSFRDVYARAVREAPDPAHFVEVGCWKGRSAAFMAVEILNSKKKIRFDCIDTWKGSDEPKHLADKSVKEGTLFREFVTNTAPVNKIVVPFPMSSVEGAKMYHDGSLDFVFIDAAHDYDNVLLDLRSWWPKIKMGGVLAGDDYNKREVAKAVHDSFSEWTIFQGSGSGKQWWVKKNERSLLRKSEC